MINKMQKAIYVPQNSNEAKQQIEVNLGNNFVSLRFQDGRSININYANIQWKIGGNRDSLLFLSATDIHQDIVYIEISKQLMKEIRINMQLTELHKSMSQKNHHAMKSSMLIAGLVAAGVLALVVWRGPIFGSIGAAIPFSLEQKIANQVFHPKLTNEQLDLVKRLSDLFTKTLHDEKWSHEFSIHISSATEPNAYATIGGHIFVNEGLITELASTEQLLGVVAHEMEHVKKRHVARSLAQAAGLFSVIQLVLGDVSGLAAILIDQGGPLLNLQYSRELEEEADLGALKILAASAIDPKGLPESLQIIMDQQKKMMSQAPASDVLEKLQKIEMLSSHPEPEKRIQSLRERAVEISDGKEFKKIDFDYEEFKKQVKERF